MEEHKPSVFCFLPVALITMISTQLAEVTGLDRREVLEMDRRIVRWEPLDFGTFKANVDADFDGTGCIASLAIVV